jgi:hypothetical protein
VNGQAIAAGAGVSVYPTAASRSAYGFSVGSNRNGAEQAKGEFEELETFNYALGAEAVLADYSAMFTPGDFAVEFPSLYINYSTVTGRVVGLPSVSLATLVNSTNFGSASWVMFSTNLTVNPGSGDGAREVWVGLRGFSGAAAWRRTRLVLDTVALTLVITEPVGGTTSRPILQVKGYSPEPLSSLAWNLVNSATNVINEPGLVLSQWYDTNTFAVTTNWFQLFDLELALGANAVTVRATDLAGNSSVTTVGCVLDFGGDTTPPVITLHWPQHGEELAAETFDLRGQVDDPTAMVSVSGLTEAPVAGLVERNGLFWVEGLPLAAGQNSLTLTATDAAGNSSAVGLTLVRGGTTIAINEPAEEVLTSPTIDLSGTVSDNTHAVWVNGVRAALGGQDESGAWLWTAAAVPLNDRGTAIMQARAIPLSCNDGEGTGREPFNGASMGNPTGPGAATGEIQRDKPARYYVETYQDDYSIHVVDEEPIPRDEYKVEVSRMRWTHGASGGGQRQWDGYLEPSESGPNHQWWRETWGADKEWLPTVPGWHEQGNHLGYYDSWQTDPPDIPLEVCNNAHVQPFTPNGSDIYVRGARSALKLETGGKGGSKRMNLFSFFCHADRIRTPRWRPPESMNNMPVKEGIPPNRLRLLGQRPGSDGYLYRVLPDNAEFDITPCANVDFYTYVVVPQKHRLRIFANGIPLAEDRVAINANACVGQKVTFSPTFVPGIPGLNLAHYQWGFSGQFVNRIGRGLPDTSETYYVDQSRLRQYAPSLWWTTGRFNYQHKAALVDVDLRFNNGQSSRVTGRGLLGVHRPQAWLKQINLYGTATFMIFENWVGYSIKIGDMNQNQCMAFNCQAASDFAGDAEYTQIVSLSSPSRSCQNALDAKEFYNDGARINKNLDPQGNVNTLELRDGPESGSTSSPNYLVGSFATYFRFRPEAGSPGDNIYVTLGILRWTIDGEAQADPWRLTRNIVISPSAFEDSSEFPSWSSVFR